MPITSEEVFRLVVQEVERYDSRGVDTHLVDSRVHLSEGNLVIDDPVHRLYSEWNGILSETRDESFHIFVKQQHIVPIPIGVDVYTALQRNVRATQISIVVDYRETYKYARDTVTLKLDPASGNVLDVSLGLVARERHRQLESSLRNTSFNQAIPLLVDAIFRDRSYTPRKASYSPQTA